MKISDATLAKFTVQPGITASALMDLVVQVDVVDGVATFSLYPRETHFYTDSRGNLCARWEQLLPENIDPKLMAWRKWA